MVGAKSAKETRYEACEISSESSEARSIFYLTWRLGGENLITLPNGVTLRGLATLRILVSPVGAKCLFTKTPEWAENRQEEHFPLQFERWGWLNVLIPVHDSSLVSGVHHH